MMTSSEFAAAQQRILERRRLRQAEVQAQLALQRTQIASSPISRLPFPFRGLAQNGYQAWNVIKGREGTNPAFRVGQADAELLDEELLNLLHGQVGEALKYFDSHLRDEWADEIQFALRAILFKLSVWDHNSSYGAVLQNLRYTDARHKGVIPAPPSRWQKSLYGLFTVGGQYAWTKWEHWLIGQEGGYDEPTANVRLLSRVSALFSTVYSVAAFASFVVFLINGRYRTLMDRILRLRLTPPTNQVSREVSFEYLNRQLVWHAFTEFLLFILPLVGISRWRRWLSRAWRKTKSIVRSGGEESLEDEEGGELAFLPERTCAICYQDQNPSSTSEMEVMAISGASGGVIGSVQTDITNPYESSPCGCIYCFVCIATKLDAEDGEGWICLRCGVLVQSCRPWNGDVLVEVARPSTGKSVSFSDDEKQYDMMASDTEDIQEKDQEVEQNEFGQREYGNS